MTRPSSVLSARIIGWRPTFRGPGQPLVTVTTASKSKAIDIPSYTNGDGWDAWYPDTCEISSEWVRGFARAIRCSFVPYEERRILPPDTPVPVTILGAPMLDAAAMVVSTAIPDCNLSRIVHAAQHFTIDDTIRIGDRFSFGARLVTHLVKAGTDILTIEIGAYAEGRRKVLATVTIAHGGGGREGIDPAAIDGVADAIMLTGTGPSDSDAYSGVVSAGRSAD